MMRSKKNPSEDFAFPSLFLVFDAKGGEEDPSIYLFSYFLFSSFSNCNIRQVLCLFKILHSSMFM
jgi:hypothetical protein